MAFGKFREKSSSENTESTGILSSFENIKPLSPLNSSSQPIATSSAQASQSAFIGSAASIIGSLKFDTFAEVGAYIEGEITSSSKLTISETGVIKGSITANELIIKGKVEGNIKALKSLAICKPAIIKGDISTPSLSIEAGVIFEGRCTMPIIETKPSLEKTLTTSAQTSASSSTSNQISIETVSNGNKTNLSATPSN